MPSKLGRLALGLALAAGGWAVVPKPAVGSQLEELDQKIRRKP